MYEFISKRTEPVTVSVVGGDHGLNAVRAEEPESERINRENIELAILSGIRWIRLTAGRTGQ